MDQFSITIFEILSQQMRVEELLILVLEVGNPIFLQMFHRIYPSETYKAFNCPWVYSTLFRVYKKGQYDMLTTFVELYPNYVMSTVRHRVLARLPKGESFIHYLVQLLVIAGVERMIELGATDINEVMTVAASYGRWDIVERMIELGATDDIIIDIINKSAHNGRWEIVERMIELGDWKKSSLSRSSHIVANYPISRGVDLNLARTLFDAAAEGQIEAMDLLISRGVDLDQPLFNAAAAGQIEAMDLLISRGANLNKALYYAAAKGEIEAMDLLISRGADLEWALFYAAAKGKMEAMDLLISRGATELDWALFNAAAKGKMEAMDLLISRGADLEWALFYAAAKGEIEAMDLLISKGATDLDWALFNAAANSEIEAMDLLISRGADANMAHAHAAAKGQIEAMDSLSHFTK
jgi:ankyrin repeat protein